MSFKTVLKEIISKFCKTNIYINDFAFYFTFNNILGSKIFVSIVILSASCTTVNDNRTLLQEKTAKTLQKSFSFIIGQLTSSKIYP